MLRWHRVPTNAVAALGKAKPPVAGVRLDPKVSVVERPDLARKVSRKNEQVSVLELSYQCEVSSFDAGNEAGGVTAAGGAADDAGEGKGENEGGHEGEGEGLGEGETKADSSDGGVRFAESRGVRFSDNRDSLVPAAVGSPDSHEYEEGEEGDGKGVEDGDDGTADAAFKPTRKRQATKFKRKTRRQSSSTMEEAASGVGGDSVDSAGGSDADGDNQDEDVDVVEEDAPRAHFVLNQDPHLVSLTLIVATADCAAARQWHRLLADATRPGYKPPGAPGGAGSGGSLFGCAGADLAAGLLQRGAASDMMKRAQAMDAEINAAAAGVRMRACTHSHTQTLGGRYTPAHALSRMHAPTNPRSHTDQHTHTHGLTHPCTNSATCPPMHVRVPCAGYRSRNDEGFGETEDEGGQGHGR